MIPIENFQAETTIEVGNAGKTEIVYCRVVGVTQGEDGTLEFVVLPESGSQRWIELRDFVTAPDGRSCWPD